MMENLKESKAFEEYVNAYVSARDKCSELIDKLSGYSEPRGQDYRILRDHADDAEKVFLDAQRALIGKLNNDQFLIDFSMKLIHARDEKERKIR